MSAFISVSYLPESEQREVEAFIKGPAPDAFVRRQYGLIDSGYWNRLRLLLGKTKAPIAFDNLVLAHLALVEETFLDEQAMTSRCPTSTISRVSADGAWTSTRVSQTVYHGASRARQQLSSI